jgi:adenylate cyclase
VHFGTSLKKGKLSPDMVSANPIDPLPLLDLLYLHFRWTRTSAFTYSYRLSSRNFAHQKMFNLIRDATIHESEKVSKGTQGGESRRLAAIMFTDIVGYTGLAQSDEPQALEILEKHNQILRPIFQKYKGKEIKTIGDSFLVEFDSALDAVNCAVEIQNTLHDYNAASNSKIRLRVGIHLGDVIHKDGDVFGDAVNIASRMQPLADPEGVCISEQVFDQIRNKVKFPLREIHHSGLKNVTIRISAYKVFMPWEIAGAESFGERRQSDKKRIAVLPFANISPDPNDEFFSDGLTEEMIARLSELKDLEVIARTSTMRYKRTDKSVAQIGSELSAGVLLEGSVRKVGNRIRVTAQLIDSNSESHLWAEKFDRDMGDIFAVQSEIAEDVSRSLQIKLVSHHGKDTEDVTAYTMYLKALQLIYTETESNLLEAITLLEGAIARDGKFVRAYSSLASAWCGLSNFQEYAITVKKAGEAARKALELGADWGEPHAIMAYVHILNDQFDKALQEAERAVELNPNLAEAYGPLGIIHTTLGELDLAIEAFSKATELDPLSFIERFNLAELLFLAHREKEALEVSEKLKELHPINPRSYLVPSYMFIFKGEFGKAQDTIDEGRKIDPDDHILRLNQGVLYAMAGKKNEAKDVLKEIDRDPVESNRLLGRLYVQAALGNVQDALDSLMRMAEIHSWPPWIKSDPVFRDLRADDRFGEFCRKVGIPPS